MKEPKYIIPECKEEVKKDKPPKTTKFKINLKTMKKEEVKENE